MRPFLLSPMNSGIDVFQEYFALRRTIRYLLILSAVDYFYLNLQSCLCQYVKDLMKKTEKPKNRKIEDFNSYVLKFFHSSKWRITDSNR